MGDNAEISDIFHKYFSYLSLVFYFGIIHFLYYNSIMISIIIPVYNQSDKLRQCLDSIIAQTYQNYEVIIVNDGSSEQLDIKDFELKFKNFKLINQENKGSNAARNRGFKEAKGKYLLFCDADIIMQPNMLEAMVSTLDKNSQVSYVYSSFLWGKKLFQLWSFDSEKLKQMPYIHTTSLIKREHFPKSGWDENIKRLQDWDLWLTMLKNNYKGIWIDKILFRVQTGGTMSNWLPSFVYKILPFLPSVRKYKKAVKVIKEKHLLN